MNKRVEPAGVGVLVDAQWSGSLGGRNQGPTKRGERGREIAASSAPTFDSRKRVHTNRAILRSPNWKHLPDRAFREQSKPLLGPPRRQCSFAQSRSHRLKIGELSRIYVMPCSSGYGRIRSLRNTVVGGRRKMVWIFSVAQRAIDGPTGAYSARAKMPTTAAAYSGPS